jgi:isoleucyl-tRNA synthetase
LPNKVKQIIAASRENKWEKTASGQLIIADETLELDEFALKLEPKNIEGAKALSNSDCVVILKMEITSELYSEGLARDLVRFIQQARKDSGLDISDRIEIKIEFEAGAEKEALQNAIAQHKDFINQQTLSLFKDEVVHRHCCSSDELKCKIYF